MCCDGFSRRASFMRLTEYAFTGGEKRLFTLYWLYDLPNWLFGVIVVFFLMTFGLLGLFTTSTAMSTASRTRCAQRSTTTCVVTSVRSSTRAGRSNARGSFRMAPGPFWISSRRTCSASSRRPSAKRSWCRRATAYSTSWWKPGGRGWRASPPACRAASGPWSFWAG